LLARLARSTPEQPVGLGRYEVTGRLGRGGMGTVYAAIDRTRGTQVALKTLSEIDAAAGMRLKREFRVVADLAHPNLAPMYELAQEAGLWFFTMEHVEGVGFRQWARGGALTTDADSMPITVAADRSSPGTSSVLSSAQTATREVGALSVVELPTRDLGAAPFVLQDSPDGELAPSVARATVPEASEPQRSIEAVRAALVELLRGLAALHDAGLWHGDVKPQNVLVREDGHVVVVDFGLAQRIGDARVSQTTGGTPVFMSPEQHAGVGVGPASDCYAVGVLLYQVLTGRVPFDSESLLELYFLKTQHAPPAPRELVPEIPADLSDIAMALLQPAPERRPTASDLLRVLAGDDEARQSVHGRIARSTFVGRRAELRRLGQAYGIARGGELIVVHAHGPSGIGKSALVRSFCRGVADVDRALWLRGRCYERESVPYKAFDGVIDELAEHLATLSESVIETIVPEWIAELAHVFPALLTVPRIAQLDSVDKAIHAIEMRRRAFAALRQLLRALAARNSLIITLDDLQWADADSVRLLSALVDDLPDARVLVIASYRRVEADANPSLREYFAASRDTRVLHRTIDLAIPSLAAADAEELARAILGERAATTSDTKLRRLTEEASGIPFFIEELARFVSAGGAEEGSISLEEAILARVRALPREQRAVLELVAVASTPVPQSVVFAATGIGAGALPVLLGLRAASLVDWQGVGVDDPVATYHDRIRDVVVGSLDERGRATRSLALGRTLAARHATEPQGPWVFEAVRHLAAAASLLRPAERIATSRLALAAGQRAREGAAFPLAFSCFERGIALLGDDGWNVAYDLALGLHAGSAEAAYLSAEWFAMTERCADVKRHGRGILDQLVAWEVEIDARIGRHEYGAAVDTGMEALALLDVELPRDPTLAQVGEAFARTLAVLERIGPTGLAALSDVADPTVAAAMRIQVRVSPAAYFARPLLLPMVASQVIETSIARGLDPTTPYALALFGIVMNTAGMYAASHTWGQLAVELLDRWPDRRLEAATRHIVFNLVCPWMVPLASTLPELQKTWNIGKRIGDLEYASYAAHGYVHSSIYVGRPLGALLDEALAISSEMRALGQVNAQHVHDPFEQLLEALTGKLANAPRLNDKQFDEQQRLASAEAAGSRSGMFIMRLAMGLSRFYLGDIDDAAEQFERARPLLDAVPSVWHLPILHQFAALAACMQLERTEAAAQGPLRARIAVSLDALRTLATTAAPSNFVHRVALVEGLLAHADGDDAAALALLQRAMRHAADGGWRGDLALGHELAARCYPPGEDRDGELVTARALYAEWGALAKLALI
jgi:predicted ATPase/serine/threonine protein kinase